MENADFLERIAAELHEIHTTFNVRMDQMEHVLIPTGDPVNCSDCRFGDFRGAKAELGLCRRYAPRPTDALTAIRWPVVRPTDCCGDGIERPGF